MSNVEPLKVAGAKKRSGEITLQRMRIFWAVAHNETMTKASKQLGLSQPSLSQQIASLETVVGTPLFERRSNQMILTEAGNFLLRKAEQVQDRKSTRLNSSHVRISYAVFCLKKKKTKKTSQYYSSI